MKNAFVFALIALPVVVAASDSSGSSSSSIVTAGASSSRSSSSSSSSSIVSRFMLAKNVPLGTRAESHKIRVRQLAIEEKPFPLAPTPDGIWVGWVGRPACMQHRVTEQVHEGQSAWIKRSEHSFERVTLERVYTTPQRDDRIDIILADPRFDGGEYRSTVIAEGIFVDIE